MNNSRNRVTALGVACFLGFGCTFAVPQKQAETRTSWQFQAEGGDVVIQLHGAPEAASLGIVYEDQAHPSLAEEAGFLRDVLMQLPSGGVDPSKLRGIQMRGFAEPDVASAIAIASLRSKQWQSFTTITGGAERVVEDLLNSTNTYNELNAVFQSYGLRVRVSGVEKVSATKCSALNLPDVDCNAYHDPRLPTGANIFLSLDKI